MRALARRVCARAPAAAATRGLARAALARTAIRGMATGATDQVKKTALYDLHVSLGGKMVPFAGYYLPVKYKDGDIESHLHCRKAASLFDVSHMGQLRIHGADRLKFLETLVPSDLFALKPNQTRLSVLTNESGGIIDDCMITNTQTAANYTYMVVNAGCKDKDIAHMRARLTDFNAKNKSDVRLEYVEDRSLLALQGPKAAAVLQSLVGGAAALDTSKLDFMYHVPGVTVGGVKDCYVTRCGYTGEDGFEISVPNAQAPALMQTILNVQPTLAAGLGARDSLRLEAGLCLYGHDLNETISPVEAALTWLIGKRRRTEGGYLGHDVISKQLGAAGVTRKRVGLAIKKGPPAREEAEIRTPSGEKVGVVTSGTFSPCLKKPVSMGYVATAHSKVGTPLHVVVRGKAAEAEVVAMPFVPSSYFKLPGSAPAKKAAPKPSASA